MNGFVGRLRKKWKRLRLKPIRVFCFHQVSDEFKPETMWEVDWTLTEQFKRNILKLKKKYTFIPLSEVSDHLAHDRFRMRRFAALTADDGWASLKNILPWLAKQKIPITLFLNPLYLDGIHYQERETEKLLTREDVASLVKEYAPYITIASHGWTHDDCKKMSLVEFEECVQKAEAAMKGMEGKIEYYAFTYGSCTKDEFEYLRKVGLIPVLMDGGQNVSDDSCVHRELLDGKELF